MPALEQTPCFDQLRTNTFGDPELLSELLSVFEEELPKFQVDLAMAIETQDGIVLSRTAHKLKSSLSALGARCAFVAEQLEQQEKKDFAVRQAELARNLQSQLGLVLSTLQAVTESGEL